MNEGWRSLRQSRNWDIQKKRGTVVDVVMADTTSKAPNLIFIMLDQLKYDALSIMGNTVLDTPNIDSIGNEGVKFELCYSQCPVCGPARTSLMTGRTIHHTSVPRNPYTTEYFGHDKIPCYDKILAKLSYATEYYGKWHAPIEQALAYNNWITPQ
eukprot:scaffold45966_cov46-Attheya_sp.AAC.3